MSIDTPIYIDTSSTIDNTNNISTTSNSNTTMSSPNGPIHIDENHPDTIHLDPSNSLVAANRPIHINTEQTPESKAPTLKDTVRPGESKLGDTLATFDDKIATALHVVGQFFKGGLYQVAKDKNVEMPDWAHQVAKVVNNPTFNEAMGATNIGAFLTYSKAAGLDSNKMLKAMEMKDAGKSPDAIYKKTGAELYEGKWGERVPYSGVEVKMKPDFHDSYIVNAKGEFEPLNKQDAFYSVKNNMPLDQVIHDHPIFKADPTTKDIRVRSMTPVEQDRYEPNTFGFAEVSNNTIVLRPNQSEANFKRSIVHEVEHIIQERHGLPQGSAAEMFKDSAYRTAENDKEMGRMQLFYKLEALKTRGQAKNIPSFDGDNVQELFTVANKGKFDPNSLKPSEMAAYKDMVKYGLEKDFNALDEKYFALKLKDIANSRKYNNTKGEVASRVGEDEVGKTSEEVSNKSYNKTMDEKVPAKDRIDSPLDVGFPTGQDFGSIYRHEGHYITPDQAKKLYDTRPDLRPIPPGFSEEKLKSVGAKQYLELVDYLKKDSTYNAWRRKGTEGDFPSNPQLQRLLKKLGIQE